MHVKEIIKKIIIIIIIFITIILLLKYLWYTELERITYENKTYEKFSDDLSLFQEWYPDGDYFKLWLPYKKNIYASPYIFTIMLYPKNSNIDSITLNEVKIIIPNEQLDILKPDTDVDVYFGYDEMFSMNEIENFKRTRNIKIDEENPSISYNIDFYDIEIPYKKIMKFNTVVSVTIHYKSGETLTKRIITEFEQKTEKQLMFPTA